MNSLIKKVFTLWIICTLLAACGVATSPLDEEEMGDASSEAQPIVTDDAAVQADAAPTGDAASAPDAREDASSACNGCFLGATCVPSTPVACGSNSACVRCPAPSVPECQEATCEGGACGIRNLRDGTGCTGGVCARGACNRCGTNDTECCVAGNRCNPGLTCVAAAGSTFQYCIGCGSAGQACCGNGVGTVTSGGSMLVARNPGGTCGVGLSCNAEGACTCGGVGEACCTGAVCREGRCRRDGTCGV